MRLFNYPLLLIAFTFFSCSEVAERIVNESKKSQKRDSIRESRLANPIATDTFEVVARKKVGADSLFLIRSFYFDRKKFSEAWFRRSDEQQQGIAHFYYPSGKICYSVLYKDGLIMDLLEAYTPDGEKRTDCVYKNGTGRLKIYHPLTDKLVLDFESKNGLKNGKYFSWYENGNKQDVGTFRNDSIIGDFYSWYKSGQMKRKREADAGTNTEIYETYFEKGQIQKKAKRVNEQLVYSKTFDTDGNLLEDYTLNDKNEMVLVKCAYGEKHKLLSRGYYVNGLKQGEYHYYHENGSNKSIEVYKNDTMLTETRWYENRQVSHENKYLHGELHGIQKEYYDNGKPRLVIEYKNGKKDGKYTSYFVNGNLYNDGSYKDGKPGDMKTYTRDGKYKGIVKYDKLKQ